MEDQSNQPDPTSASAAQQMLSFIKDDLWGITKRYFREPVSGVQELSRDPSANAPLRALTLMLLGALVLYLGFHVILGDATEGMPMKGHLFVLATPILFMMVMTSISFGIKKATKAGGQFKDELTTGALYVFPLVVILIVCIAFKSALASSRDLSVAILEDTPFFTLAVFYAFLMMINTIKQSMKASGVGELLSWYLSPAAVFLGFYVTTKLLETIVTS